MYKSDQDEIKERLAEVISTIKSIKEILNSHVSNLPTGVCAAIHRELNSMEVDVDSIARTGLQLIDYIQYIDKDSSYTGNVTKSLDDAMTAAAEEKNS